MFELLKQIPIAVWSVLLGSLLTLLGVLIANRENTRRLKIQLEHDSKEKSIERRAELRKDIYLSAAEECVKANAFLASISNLDLTRPDFANPMQTFFAASAKEPLINPSIQARRLRA